jgi:hypothetical protein
LASDTRDYPLPLRISKTTLAPALTPSLLENSNAALFSNTLINSSTDSFWVWFGSGTELESRRSEEDEGKGMGRAPKEVEVDNAYIVEMRVESVNQRFGSGLTM